jgi:hypothetical protein
VTGTAANGRSARFAAIRDALAGSLRGADRIAVALPGRGSLFLA